MNNSLLERYAPALGKFVLLAFFFAVMCAAGSGCTKRTVEKQVNTSASKKPKVIVVVFGGGTRSSESMDDPKHQYIPRLWNEMVPQGALFTNVRVEHKIVHPNATGSIVTGHWEWDDNDWSKPVAHPTIFEIFRKAQNAPDTSAWAFVYASILAKAGVSGDKEYGAQYGANVVVPPTIPRSTAAKMDEWMGKASTQGDPKIEAEALRKCAALTRSTSRISLAGLRSKEARDFMDREFKNWKSSGKGSTSHDLFLTENAIKCMRKFSPDVLFVAYGEIDCAHYGSWSRYVDAIRQTDELTYMLWKTVQELPDYKDNTLFIVLPDHGRELERSGGAGFMHHSNFYTNEDEDEGCRRVWMVATGPGIKPKQKIDIPTPITAVADTVLQYFGLSASPGAAPSIWKSLSK